VLLVLLAPPVPPVLLVLNQTHLEEVSLFCLIIYVVVDIGSLLQGVDLSQMMQNMGPLLSQMNPGGAGAAGATGAGATGAAAGGAGFPFMPPPPVPSQPPAPAQDPKEKYATQLQSLKDMGFINEAANLDALKATNGNVEAAVERLLNMLG